MKNMRSKPWPSLWQKKIVNDKPNFTGRKHVSFFIIFAKNIDIYIFQNKIWCILSPPPLPGPCIVLEKKVFRGSDTFYCPTGVDAEITSLLPEDKKPMSFASVYRPIRRSWTDYQCLVAPTIHNLPPTKGKNSSSFFGTDAIWDILMTTVKLLAVMSNIYVNHFYWAIRTASNVPSSGASYR